MKNSLKKSSDNTKFWFYAIIFSGVIVYWNSFSVPFLFDDKLRILEVIEIRHFWKLLPILKSTRPVVNLTLAFNYALDQYHVFGYHLFNLLVHIFVAFFIFLILKKTFELPVFKNRSLDASTIAGVSALIWTVHPLNTECVTYVIQRSESLMGLFLLWALYALIRSEEEKQNSGRWKIISIIALLLGMGCKQSIISAPVVFFCYYYIFLAKPSKKIQKARFWFYGAMIFSLVAVFVWSFASYKNIPEEIIFPYQKIAWFHYLISETQVLVHYLKLSIWPNPLCFDYAWPPFQSWKPVLLPSIFISALLVLSFRALLQKKPISFIGVWFFLILAPTSSFFPFPDLIFEHRMYLPLISIIVLVVLGAQSLIHRFCKDPAQRKKVSVSIFILTLVVFGGLTIRRNQDYRSEIAIWKDTILKRPNNSRAYNNLGVGFAAEDKLDEALIAYQEAIRLNPTRENAYVNIGNALTKQGDFEQAIQYFENSLQLKQSRYALNGLGVLYEKEKKYDEAYHYYLQALEGHPEYGDAHFNIANILMKLGKIDEAITHFETAIRLKPENSQIFANLGNAYLHQGNKEKAEYYFEEVLRVNPKDEIAQNSLGVLLATEGKNEEAIPHYIEAIKSNSNYMEPYNNLGGALLSQGRIDEAINYFKEAVRLHPDYALAQNNLKIALKKRAENKPSTTKTS